GFPLPPLPPSYASAAAVDVLGAEDVGAAFASGKCHSSKGKDGTGGGSGSGGGGGGSTGGGGVSGGGGDGGSGGGRARATQWGGYGNGQREQQQRRSETPSPQQLREWFAHSGASGGSGSCPYVICTGERAGQTCGKPHTQHSCFSRLDDAWRAEFGDEAERPRWVELLRSGVSIFDLDYDAILAAMYALSVSAEGDCYLCVRPDPGIEAAALGASESAFPVRLQHRERFREDHPVLCLHSDRGGEFSFDLLRYFCRGDGLLQSFTLPASPQQNGIVERYIGLVMEVA
ncbi:unnamed protein product, partial [Closterium sp. NIES-54]